MYCIYRVTNNVNGKTYIGQHQYTDEKDPMKYYKGSGKALKQAYKKYGEENFSIEVLYKRIRDKETVNSMEIWAIAKERKENKNGCYNIAKGGHGRSVEGWTNPNKGKSLSDEHKRKISNAKRGHKVSEETRKKISKAEKGNKNALGKHLLSEETKQKMSKINKGNKYALGYRHTDEAKQKMSDAHKGQNPWNKGDKGKLHWCNNGIKSVMVEECPEGFVPGRIRRKTNE